MIYPEAQCITPAITFECATLQHLIQLVLCSRGVGIVLMRSAAPVMNLSAAVPIHIMELKKSEKLKNGNSFPLIPQEAQ